MKGNINAHIVKGPIKMIVSQKERPLLTKFSLMIAKMSVFSVSTTYL